MAMRPFGREADVRVKPAGFDLGIQDDLAGPAKGGFPEQPGPGYEKTADPARGRFLVVSAPPPQGGDVLDFQPGVEEGGFQRQVKHPDDPAVHRAGEEPLVQTAQEAIEQEPDVEELQVDVRHLHEGVHAERERDEQRLSRVLDGAAEDHPVVPLGSRDPARRVFRFQGSQLRRRPGARARDAARPLDGRVDLMRDHQPQSGLPDLARGPQEIALPAAFDQLAFAQQLSVPDEQPALDGRRALVDENELFDPDGFPVENEMEVRVGNGLGRVGGPDAADSEQIVQRAADVGGPGGDGVDGLLDVFALDHVGRRKKWFK